MTTDFFKVQKVQHPIIPRLLTVKQITELSPAMRRITFTGDNLAGFLSASFDDHVKLMMPEAQAEKPNIPVVGPKGLEFDESKPKPVMRDYTPRRYDPVSNELDIDFVLHHEGPATEWATHAEVGHFLGIAGPRGSFVIPMFFDWHLLIGDETAMPAIGRRLEELPKEAKAIVLIKTMTEDAKIKLSGQCQFEVQWVTGADSAGTGTGILEAAVRNITLPEGEGYVWAAGEYNDIKAVRQCLVNEKGIDKSRIRAASYWRKAVANTHENFD